MLLPFEEIKKILKSTWPKLTYIWPRDQEYVLPSLQELKAAVVVCTNYPHLECDDRSLLMMAELLLNRMKENNFAPVDSWAIGEAVGTFKVSFETHSLLIVVCDDMQVRLIEPSDNQIWIPDPKVDQPFFVDFH